MIRPVERSAVLSPPPLDSDEEKADEPLPGDRVDWVLYNSEGIQELYRTVEMTPPKDGDEVIVFMQGEKKLGMGYLTQVEGEKGLQIAGIMVLEDPQGEIYFHHAENYSKIAKIRRVLVDYLTKRALERAEMAYILICPGANPYREKGFKLVDHKFITKEDCGRADIWRGGQPYDLKEAFQVVKISGQRACANRDG